MQSCSKQHDLGTLIAEGAFSISMCKNCTMQQTRKPKIVRANKWRKRYQCKKTKSKHTWELIYAQQFAYFGWIFIDYRCIHCGKEKSHTLYK
jgi:hypothetical protein